MLLFAFCMLKFTNEHSTVFLLMDHLSMPRHVAAVHLNERMRAELTKRRMKTDVASATNHSFFHCLSEKKTHHLIIFSVFRSIGKILHEGPWPF